MGNTVLFLYPTPNVRNEPSLLYKNPGLKYTINAYNETNNIIEKETKCLLINVLDTNIIPIL